MADNKGTILIADDKEIIREVIEMHLSKALFGNYSYKHFSTGTQLEQRLRGNLEDVVLLITDNNMEEGPTGKDLAIKYAPRVNFPVILHYSGNDSIGEAAIQAGAESYFKKPSAWENLTAKCKELLEPQ